MAKSVQATVTVDGVIYTATVDRQSDDATIVCGDGTTRTDGYWGELGGLYGFDGLPRAVRAVLDDALDKAIFATLR